MHPVRTDGTTATDEATEQAAPEQSGGACTQRQADAIFARLRAMAAAKRS